MKRGTEVGKVYVKGTVDGSGMNKDIVDSVEDAEPGLEKAGDRGGEKYGNRFSARFRDRIDSMRGAVAEKLSERLSDEGERAGKHAGDRAGKSFSKRFTDKVFDDDFADRIGERFAERFLDAVQKRLDSGDLSISVSGNDDDDGSRRTGGGRRARGTAMGDRVGRLFGAGGRNNVLNALGKSMGGLINLTEKARRGASGLFSTFVKGFTQAGEGASFLQKTMSGFSKVGAQGAALGSRAMASLAASGPAAAAAVVIVVAALVTLVSVMGALIGIATAFTATIAGGLVAAMTVGAGAMLAVVAAGGLLTAAFMSMTDAQKNLLSTAFRPLREEMVGIGQIMIREMVPAFQTWSENLQNALYLLAPVAQVMGRAFADAGNILTESFSGPGFVAFSTALGVYLPNIVRNLSTALGGFLNGLLGLFSAVMPYVGQFSAYLADVSARFSEWANSAQGQNSIADFVSRAVESLGFLWNAVQEITGFISDVLFSPEAMDAGNTIFAGIIETFAGFREQIAQAQADGSLRKFFEDAVEFGGDFWNLMQGLGSLLRSLYSSGVLTALGDAFNAMAFGLDAGARGIDMLTSSSFFLPAALAAVLGPLGAVAAAVIAIGDAIRFTIDLINKIPGVNIGSSGTVGKSVGPAYRGLGKTMGKSTTPKAPSMGGVIRTGKNALKRTSGGGGGGGRAAAYKNPYIAYANSLMIAERTILDEINKNRADISRAFSDSLSELTKSANVDSVTSSLVSMANRAADDARATLSSAEGDLNTAAQRLASASSKVEANAALYQVSMAQKALADARYSVGLADEAARIIRQQGVWDESRVQRNLMGVQLTESTLADIAETRRRLAEKITDANAALESAIQLRDDYSKQVAGSVRDFGSLITAEASMLNGVQAALTATDITSNLQDRLAKIRAFQENLRLLMAMGISQDAYKQIVDAGVDGGSDFASALVNGGISAVQDVNGLISQISVAADELGGEASNKMYQAGVDAAQGLLDGLNSLSSEIESAAAAIGNHIADQIRRTLGIASPSRVLRAEMNNVGDGIALGLGDQKVKVGNAAAGLADQIAVSPEVARYAASQGESATVSGNNDDPRIRDLHIHTPTEDPKAVAEETLNELTGRL